MQETSLRERIKSILRQLNNASLYPMLVMETTSHCVGGLRELLGDGNPVGKSGCIFSLGNTHSSHHWQVDTINLLSVELFKNKIIYQSKNSSHIGQLVQFSYTIYISQHLYNILASSTLPQTGTIDEVKCCVNSLLKYHRYYKYHDVLQTLKLQAYGIVCSFSSVIIKDLDIYGDDNTYFHIHYCLS